MKNQPGNMKNQPGTMKNHENRPGTMNNQPGTMNTHENRPGTINKQKRYKQTDTQNLPIIYRSFCKKKLQSQGDLLLNNSLALCCYFIVFASHADDEEACYTGSMLTLSRTHLKFQHPT